MSYSPGRMLDIKIVDRSGDGCTIDRNSTRLNSSHLVLSYADFCLKKKGNRLLDGSRHTAIEPGRHLQAGESDFLGLNLTQYDGWQRELSQIAIQVTTKSSHHDDH